MKKIVMTFIAVLATVMIVGCSKTSKYESVCREVAALAEKNGGPKMTEEDIKKEVEKFSKMSSDQQDAVLKAAEAMLDAAKTMTK